MRFVFDENVGEAIVDVIAKLGVNAVSSTHLRPAGTLDPDLIPALHGDDVLVTFDKSMLGEHTDVLIQSSCAVVKLKGHGLRFRQKIGLFLCFEDTIATELAKATRPCVVNVSRTNGVSKFRPIQRQSLPYGSP